MNIDLKPNEVEALIKAARLGRLRGKSFGYLNDRHHLINAQTKLITELEKFYAKTSSTTSHQPAQAVEEQETTQSYVSKAPRTSCTGLCLQEPQWLQSES